MTHTPSTPLNEEALQASIDAYFAWMYKDALIKNPISKKERERFERDNREEFEVTIGAYLAALPTTPDRKSSLEEAIGKIITNSAPNAGYWEEWMPEINQIISLVRQHESSLSAAAKVEAPPRDEITQELIDGLMDENRRDLYS